MFEVTVRRTFAGAHYLRNYQGKCERLHGHNWVVYLTVKGSQLDGCGMLVDFGILKDALDQVLAELDHQCLNDLPAFSKLSPSCENLARYIYEACQVRLSDASQPSPYSVTVHETENCSATFSPS